jgi:uncharacterized protein (DUF885 family)
LVRGLQWAGRLLIAACLVVLVGPRAFAASGGGDVEFRRMVARFIDSEMRLFPERATDDGDHRFDDRLSDLSPSGMRAKIRHAHIWKGRFSALRAGTLSAPNEADREWLIASLDSELLWEEELKSYRTDPQAYMPTAAVYSLISRDFAPPAERMRSVTARERAALAKLGQARRNLSATLTPKVTVDIALQQMPATIGFFKKDVPLAFATLHDDDARRNFSQANDRLIAAVTAYRQWLVGFRTKASGSFRLGRHTFKRMLADDDMVDTPLARLEELGKVELARLQTQFKRTAATIDGHQTPAEVFKALSSRHPKASEIIPAVTAGLGELRTFVIAHHLATIPSAPEPAVRETPPFARATTFAAMDSPGPLEKKATEAFFYVTLPDPSWPAQRREQLLAFFSPPSISDFSVHEVYPGHYVQFLDNRNNPDLVRSLFYSGANVEGWAFYCEQMMLDEGLHGGAADYRLAQLQLALQRVCRYLVAIAMHTGSMTVKQAAAFFEQNAYMTPNNAMVEALRGTQDPGYLRYQLGKFMILKLRRDVKEKEGAAFNLGEFHDAFLSQGGLPIKLIRRAMLGAAGGPQL